jgi:putative ABC transport system ATP-binding protein
MTFLEARNLAKCFRQGTEAEVWALEDVSLVVAAGSFAVLTGPSGSGKSTLLGLLGALDRPTRGQVIWAGRDLTTLSHVELGRVRRRIGFVFQSFALIPRLSLWENITYPLIPRGVPIAERHEIARALLGRFGMSGKISKTPEQLSAGEQQRVAVARALAGSPELLLADEPTSNLDRATAASLLSLFQEFHASGKTVLVSSHDPDLIGQATHVYQLDAAEQPPAQR